MKNLFSFANLSLKNDKRKKIQNCRKKLKWNKNENETLQEVERLASLLKRKSYQHQPVPSSKRLRNHCRLESAAIHCEDQNVNLFSLTYRLGFFFCMFFHLKTFYYLLFFSEYFTSTQRNETKHFALATEKFPHRVWFDTKERVFHISP